MTLYDYLSTFHYAVCEEAITTISTREYVKEIIVTSNVKETEKVITETWKSESTDEKPTINIEFKKVATITDIILENLANINKYS